MIAHDIIQKLLLGKNTVPVLASATCFAPVNIALIKYWGKRDTALNLPLTASLSITLPSQGTVTTLRTNALTHDRYYLNGEPIFQDKEFSKRLQLFCNFFRFNHAWFFDIETHNTIPTAAGLASSASGFCALVLAFDRLFSWQLDRSTLSILARFGSGSACRSLWPGFVEWHKGERQDGLDSFAQPLSTVSPLFLSKLRVGLLIFEKGEKMISSRQAMLNTVNTSPSYQHWPAQVAEDLQALKRALITQDFSTFGAISERNALAMHTTLSDSQPSTDYCTSQTLYYRQKIWALRQKGIPVYFTQDAGPNLKLLFQEETTPHILAAIPNVEVLTLHINSA